MQPRALFKPSYDYETRMTALRTVLDIADSAQQMTALETFIAEEELILRRLRPYMDRSQALDSARNRLASLQNPNSFSIPSMPSLA